MKNINTILIANRGEIASRVIRTCKKMGITAVAVYSDSDANAPYVKEADMAIHIGTSEPAKSYLVQDKIIKAARRSNADAIHPGYGFLSENADFARTCKKEGIIFIGPNPEAIEAMGSKSRAKTIMDRSGVPIISGYQGQDQSEETLIKEAVKIGFPLLLKATAGGGGKGMRIVYKKEELQNAIQSAKREAKSAFGDDELIIEKYIESGRHIEFQIFGDQQGNLIHLLERECTIQRRYQKVIEESPSPIMTEELRTQMGEAAVLAAKALKYDNAGTVEFIFDDKTGSFFFLEVNTRLQVEHPVTEAITGLDLVQMQIESAQGLSLQINQDQIKGNGYAIEVRLYAEDPVKDFAPVTGTVHRFEYPKIEGLRVESAIESGSEISMFYDPMIAKIIVQSTDRKTAHGKMKYVLQNLICQGTITNQNFLLDILDNKDVEAGKYDTHFIANHSQLYTSVTRSEMVINEALIAVTLYQWHTRERARKVLIGIPSGWRNNFYDYQKEVFLIEDQKYMIKYQYIDGSFVMLNRDHKSKATIINVETGTIRIDIDGIQKNYAVSHEKNQYYVHSSGMGNIRMIVQERFPHKEKVKVKGGYESPIPSQIIKIHVSEGDTVNQGDPLMVISSMKMETHIEANEKGLVEEVYVDEGDNVEAGFLLLKIKEK